MKGETKKKIRPAQSQDRPGQESKLMPEPDTRPKEYPKGKLAGKVALITGGDSGIGKAVALLFAQQGADIAIAYLNEHEDAASTQKEIVAYGRKCLLIAGDLSQEKNCKAAVDKTLKEFKKIDILINNAALHWEQEDIEDIGSKQLQTTFQTDFYSYFWMCQYCMPHFEKGGNIVNTASVVAYRGSPKLLDYAAAKGAVIAFTRSLATNLMEQGIRVNAVAPGPVWTPLIASTFALEDVAKFGSDAPMKRAGMPNEIAPCYLFLASDDASFISGQTLHPNGGEVING